MSDDLPPHLGGHCGYTNTDIGVLNTIIRRRHPKSFFDIGCGTGEMLTEAEQRGVEAFGVDGDFTLDFGSMDVEIHDFAESAYYPYRNFDLGWSVEFLEHIEERFLDNVRPSFVACRYVFVTHALPKQPGHHHVNCRSSDYWIDVFDSWGFAHDSEFSKVLRRASSMKEDYARRSGLFFEARL